ncbi:MAG: putative Ig domain-containing protein, partial [Thermoplasmata archaeon]|nr:putative Ig domain-containing protein [Thermoplasmata archaeon]
DNNNTNGASSDYDIFYRGNLTGSSWEEIQVISEPVLGKNFNTGESVKPDIVINSGKRHVVWRDNNNTNGAGNDEDIFYRGILLPIALNLPSVTPTFGNTSTDFNFTVTYNHVKNKAPTEITVNISGIKYLLLEVDPADLNYIDGKDYYFNITHLDVGVHTHRFYASDGLIKSFTTLVNRPIVYNTPPNITTLDNLTILEDEYYEVNYEYDDIDVANVGQSIFWNYSSNASWLAFDNATAILNGTPTNDDVGQYWINISVNDTMDIDFTNFTLTVIEVNDNPVINTTDIEITYEDAVYFVDYNATDIDSLIANQLWNLETNASTWLDIDTSTGILSGTPTNDEVGSYGVNVSVNDSENGEDFTNFTLFILNVNDPPIITTDDILNAPTGTLYEVDYNATDIDPTNDTLTWSLDTNASWLGIDTTTGVLSGTPTVDNIGFYGVNVSVDDGNDGTDWHEFGLEIVKGNDPPVITTTDVVSASVDVLYYVDYEAIDDRTPFNELSWSLATDAGWLSLVTTTGILSGTPQTIDLGAHWVNISVSDGEGGIAFHNFTLTVYSESNQPPQITAQDDLNAVVGEDYLVDYDATDDRTPVEYLQWSVKTNASWLTMHMNTGVLSGTPEINDIGWYIVNVSVFDGEDGWDYHNFVLTVTSEPIEENNAPELSNPGLTPSEGDVKTEFTFTVHYYDEDVDVPSSIRVFIDNGSYDMTLKEG